MRSKKISLNQSESLTIRLSPQLLDKLDIVSYGYKVSRSECVRMILEKSLMYVKESNSEYQERN